MHRLAPLFVIFAAALWGIDGIVLRPALYNLPVALVVCIETLIIALILTPFFIDKGAQFRALSGKDWLAFVAVALFGGAIGTMAITRALFYVNYVNLSIVVLIQKLQPVFAISLAALLLKERLPRTFFIWAGVAVLGAYLMTFGFSSPGLGKADKTTFAAGFALLATLSFASSTVFSKRALRRVSFQLGTYLRFLMTAVLMVLIVLSLNLVPSAGSVSAKQWVVLLIIAFSTGGPAIFMYYYGLKRISASAATIYELAFPLTAVVLEYILRHHILSWVQWGGVALLLIGIIRVTGMNVILDHFQQINED